MHRFTAADWHNWVHRCTRVAGTREDAEDCVQEALAAALAASHGEIDDLRSWVGTVARRRAVDVVRRRTASARALARAAHADHTPDPADDVTAKAAARWLTERLDELPATTAAVVRRLADGMTLGNAATELGLSYRAAESHVTRARRWARRELAY